MSEYIAFEDCVARYEGWDIFPTEWQGFPIHHTDPFWNAALFDEPPYPGFRAVGTVVAVSGDWAPGDVSLPANPRTGGPTLWIKESVNPQAFIDTTK